MDVKNRASMWYERVPTPSNPADAPSRFDATRLLSDFPEAVEVDPIFPAKWMNPEHDWSSDEWFVDVFRNLTTGGAA